MIWLMILLLLLSLPQNSLVKQNLDTYRYLKLSVNLSTELIWSVTQKVEKRLAKRVVSVRFWSIPYIFLLSCNLRASKYKLVYVGAVLFNLQTNSQFSARSLTYTTAMSYLLMFLFKAMAGNVIPAIIVQGGGFALNVDRTIYKETTERAANVGYDVLMVSVIDKYITFSYETRSIKITNHSLSIRGCLQERKIKYCL